MDTLKNKPYNPIRTRNTKYVPIGIPTLSHAHNDLQSGTVTVITGSPGCGKSTVAHGIALGAINQNFKVMIVDGEHERDSLLNSLYAQVIGGDSSLYDKILCNVRMKIEPKPHIQKQIDEWIGDNLVVFHSYDSTNENFDELFYIFEGAVDALGIDIIFFDNLMSLVSSSQAEMNAKQSDFMKRCCKLSKKSGVPVVLVAHPNGTIDIRRKMSYYQISGSADIPNLASNVWQVVKNPSDEDGNVMADGKIYVLKNREFGEEPEVILHYDSDSRSLCEMNNGIFSAPVYNWRVKGEQIEWERQATYPMD